jgi:pimeloyl-ACP methyl ester carboxylesterase
MSPTTKKTAARGGKPAPDPDPDRQFLYTLLGDLPDRQASLAARTVGVEERAAYHLERLVLDLNGQEDVPAYFVRPRKAATHYPAILYSHAHGNDHALGKDEVLRGRPELQPEPYAEALAARGYAVLAIDQWNFGERRGRTESELFKELLWKGKVLFGLMVYDCLRAVDYLCARPDVDSRRIGTLGMSMGSTLSWWTAALEPRVAAVVDICCLTDFHSLIDRRGLDGHGIYYYVPGLLKHFTTARIQALICPRPHLSLAGIHDPLTPPEGLDVIDRQMKRLYGQAGAPGAWQLERYGVGHVETAAMRAEVMAFLQKHLHGEAGETLH